MSKAAWKLFLDDERDPASSVDSVAWRQRAGLPSHTLPASVATSPWVVCRSFSEAVSRVEEQGFPSFVSFDHDLGEEPPGKAFADWLIARDLDDATMPSDFL